MQLDGSQARVLSACLDTLAVGIVICTIDGKVVYANAMSRILASEGGALVLRNRGKVLEASGPIYAPALRQLISDAASGHRSGAMNITGEGDSADGYVVLVKPLPPSVGRYSGGHAVVAFRPVADKASFAYETLVTLFRLSPAQARLALALYDGQSVEGYAAGRGIMISTVRTHLADVFARTGTQNQRDLVRLLGTVPPLR